VLLYFSKLPLGSEDTVYYSWDLTPQTLTSVLVMSLNRKAKNELYFSTYGIQKLNNFLSKISKIKSNDNNEKNYPLFSTSTATPASSSDLLY
jgi:hypothetical protein